MDDSNSSLQGRRVVLGVSGSIAAYKACILASLLVKQQAEVYPILTRGGARFVTAESLAALCSHPTLMDEFDQPDPTQMSHIALARDADAIVVAPASANVIARMAGGLADDMLTLVLLATRAPVLIAPAMNSGMWEHPLVQRNIHALKETGYHIVEPAEGRMACGTTGPGKLAEPHEIVSALQALLKENDRAPAASHAQDLTSWRLLVTAGPTQEPIDAVRFLGNRSSGKMGYAIARAAIERGARVTLVTGPTKIDPPVGATVVQVQTAAQMLAAVTLHAATSTVVIGAAAVADFTVDPPFDRKIKRGSGPVTLTLKPTVDILSEIGRSKEGRIHVGFAAEAGDPTASGASKLISKNLDLIVANDITAPGAGFDSDTNLAAFIDRDGTVDRLPLMSKVELAHRLLDRIRRLYSQ